jgi:hypothetical protein
VLYPAALTIAGGFGASGKGGGGVDGGGTEIAFTFGSRPGSSILPAYSVSTFRYSSAVSLSIPASRSLCVWPQFWYAISELAQSLRFATAVTDSGTLSGACACDTLVFHGIVSISLARLVKTVVST